MRLAMIVTACVLLLACQQTADEKVPAGHVQANAAYRQHFGEPPKPREGVAFARVGYLPTSERPGQVQAIPLYLFNENNQLELILAQLFSSDLVLSRRSGLLRLSGWGISLEKIEQTGDGVQVFLKTVAPAQSVNKELIARAITETAGQFEDILRVQVLFAGQALDSAPEAGYQAQKSRIAKVGKPDLIGAFGGWELGSPDPKEILIIFNRPIQINQLQVLDRAGQPVSGDFYTSMFNMAVVLHPEKPANFKEGTELRVEWDISDQLGRPNSGKDMLRLKRTNH